MQKDTYQNIHETIQGARKVLVVSHQHPDGDTIGSGLALSYYLDGLGKPHTLFCVDDVHPTLQFLPHRERYTKDPEAIRSDAHDVIVVVDASDLAYAGVAEHVGSLASKPTILNIDHHATNAGYGRHNLVEPHRASTTEVLYHYFDALRVPISPEMATCLLTGVLTDTGTFSNPATNETVFLAASRLMILGARVRDIMFHIMKNKSVAQLTLWGRALVRLKEDPETGYLSTAIRQHDLDDCNATAEDADGLANFLGGITSSKAVIFLREQTPDKVKGSLRTTSDLIDVAEIAKLYGGGGHRKAAGFTVTGQICETPTQWTVESAVSSTASSPTP